MVCFVTSVEPNGSDMKLLS